MAESATHKKDRLFINIPPGFRRQVKARAALERLANPGDPISWEEVKREKEALEQRWKQTHSTRC